MCSRFLKTKVPGLKTKLVRIGFWNYIFCYIPKTKLPILSLICIVSLIWILSLFKYMYFVFTEITCFVFNMSCLASGHTQWKTELDTRRIASHWNCMGMARPSLVWGRTGRSWSTSSLCRRCWPPMRRYFSGPLRFCL